MVEFKLTINKKQHTVYINKNIIDAFGYELGAQLNATSGVIYPLDANKNDIIRSLDKLTEIVSSFKQVAARLEALARGETTK